MSIANRFAAVILERSMPALEHNLPKYRLQTPRAAAEAIDGVVAVVSPARSDRNAQCTYPVSLRV